MRWVKRILFLTAFFGCTEIDDMRLNKILPLLTSSSPYSSELQAVINKARSESISIPTSVVLAAYDEYLIGALKSSSVLTWSNFKSLHIYGFGSTEFGTINLKNASTYRHTYDKTTFPKNPTFAMPPDGSGAFGVKSTLGTFLNTHFRTDEWSGIETTLTIGYDVAESSTDFSSVRVVTGGGQVNMQPLLNATLGIRQLYHIGNSFSSVNHQGLYIDTYNGTADINYKNGAKDTHVVTPTAPSTSVDLFFLANNSSSTIGGSTPGAYYPYYTRMMFTYQGQWTDAMELEFRTIYNTAISAIRTAFLAYQVAPVYYLVIDMGQSNSEGLAEVGRLFLTDYTATPPNCYSYYKGVFNSADNGCWDLFSLGNNTNNNSYTTCGAEVSLGPLLRDRLDRPCFYIKAASGGTDLHTDWNPSIPGSNFEIATQYYYDLALPRMRAMIPPDAIIKPILLWHQGEADGADGRTKAEYQADLANFWLQFRGHDSAMLADAPLFITRIKPNTGNYANINLAIVDYAASVPNTYVIDISDQPTKEELTTEQKGGVIPSSGVDDGHESYLAQIAKGERIYDQIVLIDY